MTIKIVSDGTGANTRILGEDGQRIEGLLITKIEWKIATNMPAEATITLLRTRLEVDVLPEQLRIEMEGPSCLPQVLRGLCL